MDDTISRQAAIDRAVSIPMFGRDIKMVAVSEIENLPSAQPDLDEWCTDCKEYDQEKHCCPRWNRVIRETAEEVRQNAEAEPKWIPVTERLPEDEDSVLITDCKWWIDIAFYDGLNWWYRDEQQLKADVSAWMPLPESYRGE